MNIFSQRTLLAIALGTLLAAGFNAPADARQDPRDQDKQQHEKQQHGKQKADARKDDKQA